MNQMMISGTLTKRKKNLEFADMIATVMMAATVKLHWVAWGATRQMSGNKRWVESQKRNSDAGGAARTSGRTSLARVMFLVTPAQRLRRKKAKAR